MSLRRPGVEFQSNEPKYMVLYVSDQIQTTEVYRNLQQPGSPAYVRNSWSGPLEGLKKEVDLAGWYVPCAGQAEPSKLR